MSEHRRAVTCPAGPSVTRRRRFLIAAIAALGASGLILGSVSIPVLAGEVNAAGDPSATVDVQDGCVTAAAGTGGADGSVAPQQGSDPATVEATGQGTATVTVCGDDPGAPSPDDPAGSLPDDPGDVVPEEIGDAVPGEPGGSLAGEVVGIVTAALDGDGPGGGDGSLPGDLPDGVGDVVPDDGGGFPGDGSSPGDPGDLPDGLGGLVPDGSGIDAGELLDRLGRIITGVGDGAGPGGSEDTGEDGKGGNAPAVDTSTDGSASVSVGGVDAERGNPAGVIPGGEFDAGIPALVGASPGGTLPRTGGGLGIGVLRLIALLGFGRGLVGLAKRR